MGSKEWNVRGVKVRSKEWGVGKRDKQVGSGEEGQANGKQGEWGGVGERVGIDGYHLFMGERHAK